MAKKALTDEEERQLRRVGHRIKAMREARGWSQEELAAKVSTPGSTLSRRRLQSIESGKHNVSLVVVLLIFAALGAKEDGAYSATIDKAHIRLHERLQELLDAAEPWPTAAQVNVDAVYNYYQSQKPKKP